MKFNDKLLWGIIESLNWAERCHEPRGYETIKYEFMMTYKEEVAIAVGDFITARFKELDAEYEAHIRNGGKRYGHFGGDDSYNDMIHHVIGLGCDTYNKVLNDLELLDDIDPVESFDYAIPTICSSFNDYDDIKGSVQVTRAKDAIAALAEVVADPEFDTEKAEIIGDAMHRFMLILAGNYEAAFEDMPKFSAYYDIHPEYMAMFGNYLKDAQKWYEVTGGV